MQNLTDDNYWNRNWKKYKNKKKVLFQNVFDKFLKKDENKNCIEIGCVPGRFLVYISKKFGYRVYGLDFADISPVENLFKKENITNYKLYKKDFLKFKSKEKFDVVTSFGFIEHFDDYDTIFKKHINLMKKDGLFILEMPNFNFGQYYLHKIFDKANLARHNLKIMNLNVLRDLCNKYGLDILNLDYYKTADFWIDNNDKHFIFAKIFANSLRVLFKVISYFVNYPNEYLSPYIMLVARKK